MPDVLVERKKVEGSRSRHPIGARIILKSSVAFPILIRKFHHCHSSVSVHQGIVRELHHPEISNKDIN